MGLKPQAEYNPLSAVSSRGGTPFAGLPLEALDMLGGRFPDDARVHVTLELVFLRNHYGSPLSNQKLFVPFPVSGSSSVFTFNCPQ